MELLKASEGLSETVQKQLEVEVESIDRRITSIRNYVDDSMESRLTSMRTFLKSTVKLFDDKLSTISSVMDGPSPAMTMRSSIANRAAPQESEERSQRFEDIEKRLRKMESDTSVSSVKFASLGFESAQDSNAWLLTHAPSHPIGLIIDPFIVMHHISINIYGRDGLHAMELARKLKLQNLDASVSVSSFECGIPRILCKEGVSTATLITESCFTRIPNFKTWDERGTGVRALVKEQLTSFAKSHGASINQAFARGAVFWSAATEALLLSVSWIEEWMRAFEDLYKQLEEKLGPKKGMHVATRLALRIWHLINKPRLGAMGQLSIGNNDQTCQRIFFAVVQVHDAMARFKENNFMDDPSITGELVRFLLLHSGFSTVERLDGEVSGLTQDLALVRKDLKSVTSGSSTAQNKLDKLEPLRKEHDALQRRVVALEKKK